MITDCFATFEVLLFVTLAARKLGASDRAVRVLLVAGLALYAGEHVCSRGGTLVLIRATTPCHVPHTHIGTASWQPAPSCAAVTRGLQLAVLLPLFIGAYAQMAGCSSLGTWWAMVVLVAILLVIQAHTFVIYAGVWRRHASPASLAPSLASSLPSNLSLRGGSGAGASSSSLISKTASDQKLAEAV